jgi:hypothetical protein
MAVENFDFSWEKHPEMDINSAINGYEYGDVPLLRT